MDVLKMEDVGPIFRNILDMTIDVVNGLPPIGQSGYPLGVVEHHEVGFDSWVRVNPYINKSVDLFCVVFSLTSLLVSLLPLHLLATL